MGKYLYGARGAPVIGEAGKWNLASNELS
jgi:hypothetical protein